MRLPVSDSESLRKESNMMPLGIRVNYNTEKEIIKMLAEKSRESVEELKRNWHSDPCYDLELTEGFEVYRDELLAFREKCEKEWDEVQKKYHAELASKICPMSFVFATYNQGQTLIDNTNCQLENCAWWNETSHKCGIVARNIHL
jgi:hypothetical protein